MEMVEFTTLETDDEHLGTYHCSTRPCLLPLLLNGGKEFMIKELNVIQPSSVNVDFAQYETKFKALADQKRLKIMHELSQKGSVCVCDLMEIMEMPQSKLSYHLRILLDAQMITLETRGTWSYYELNHAVVNRLLSPELCCIFRSIDDKQSGCCS